MTAVVAGLPRSWQTAPSMMAISCGRSRSAFSSRALSTTMSVCVQTSPSGCQSGSCSQPTSGFSSGRIASTTPRSSASASPIDGRSAASSSFSSSVQTRSAARSSSGMLRHNAAVASSSVNSKRAANWTARRTRRLSSPKVRRSTARSTRRSRSALPSNGSS